MKFCFWCGTGPVILISKHWWCNICKAEFTIETITEAQLTLEEAEEAFNKIPLTDKKAIQARKRKR